MKWGEVLDLARRTADTDSPMHRLVTRLELLRSVAQANGVDC